MYEVIRKEKEKVPSGKRVRQKAGDHAFSTTLAPGATSRVGRILCSRGVFFSVSTEELHPPLIFSSQVVHNSLSLQFSPGVQHLGVTSPPVVEGSNSISPMDSGKSPSRAPSLDLRRPGSVKGFPAAEAAVRPARRAQPSPRRARRGGRRLRPPGLGAGGGAAGGSERRPSSRPSRRSLPSRARAKGTGRGAAPPASPAPLRRVPRGRFGRRPQLAPWARGAAGRVRAGNFAAARGAAPPGARASVQRSGGLRGAAAESGTGRKRERRRPAAREAEAPRGAGCRDLNSAGAAPRTRPDRAAAALRASSRDSL